MGWPALATAGAGGRVAVTAEHRPQQIPETIEEPVHAAILPISRVRRKAGWSVAAVRRNRGAGPPRRGVQKRARRSNSAARSVSATEGTRANRT